MSSEGADLVEFLRARLDEDEQWALGASKPYRYAEGSPAIPARGVHWTWVVGENWEPITPDPAVDEFVARNDEWSCNLATVEEWPNENGGHMMPTTYAGTIEEMDAVAARHIARHDPARVLREVEAKRQIVATFVALDTHPNRLTYAHMQQQWVALRAVIAALTLPYADHPDFQQKWGPMT